MTQLSPTALEEAAKAVEQDLSRDMAVWVERYTGPHGCDDDAPEPPKGNYRSTPTRLATAAITAYLAQAEKEGWVMVPVGMVRKVTSIARRNEDAPEIGALSVAGFLRDDLTYDDIAGLHQVVKQEIRSIIRMALDHPEARTVVTRPSPGAADE